VRDRSEPDEKSIKGIVADKALEIPLKPKPEAANGVVPTNGEAESNGVHPPESGAKVLKRARPDDDEVVDMSEAKKAKTTQAEAEAEDDDVVLVEDGGAILIEDD
jgi:hypothetical protein